MEAPRRAANRQKQRSRRFWIIIAIIVLVVLVVIIVPTAVVLGGRTKSTGLASSVILPLYIYPLGDAWKPLYDAYVLRFSNKTLYSG
jgi:flagellar basal body-associated protein FliL